MRFVVLVLMACSSAPPKPTRPPAMTVPAIVVTPAVPVAPSPARGWTRRVDEVTQWRHVAVDRAGRVFVAGEQRRGEVLARLDGKGMPELVVSYAETSILGLSIDPAGDVIIAGHYGDEPQGVFVAKLSPELVVRWIRHGKAKGDWSQANYLAVDAGGRIAIAGYFRGTLNLGGKTLRSSTETAAFVGMLAPDGKHLWSLGGGRELGGYANDVVVAHDGSLYTAFNIETVAGTHGGGKPLPPRLVRGGQWEIELRKYTAEGGLVWRRRMPGPGGAQARRLVVMPNDDVVVAATLFGRADFGTGPVDAGLDEHVDESSVVARYAAADGAVRWVQHRAHESDSEYREALALDHDGSIVHAGLHRLAALDPDTGADRWSMPHAAPSYAPAGGEGLVIDDLATLDGELVAVGGFVTIGPRREGGLMRESDRDGLMARIAGDHRWPRVDRMPLTVPADVPLRSP